MIEECPSPLLTPALRKRMGNAAVKLAQSVGYMNAGTMEFLVDRRGSLLLHRDEHAHPGGAHHHRGSLRLRSGEGTDSHRGGRTTFAARRQAAAASRTPSNAGSMRRIRRGISSPRPGRIAFYYAPGGRGVRIDSHAYTGYIVPPHYDSMIAKLIAVGATRESAIARMRRALGEYLITGIKTTIPFHNAIMRNADFRNGNYDTGFVERLMNSENVRAAAVERPPARLSAVGEWPRRAAASTAILDLATSTSGAAPGIARAMIRGRRRSHSASRQKAERGGAHATLAEELHRLTTQQASFH